MFEMNEELNCRGLRRMRADQKNFKQSKSELSGIF